MSFLEPFSVIFFTFFCVFFCVSVCFHRLKQVSNLELMCCLGVSEIKQAVMCLMVKIGVSFRHELL